MSELQAIENVRTNAIRELDNSRQQHLEQFFTPIEVVTTMVNLFNIPSGSKFKILDPGAGTGILGLALAKRIWEENPDSEIELIAVELDHNLSSYFEETVQSIGEMGKFNWKLVNQDFFTWSSNEAAEYDFVIQNPPYRKLSSKSKLAEDLLSRGIQTPNLYSSFVNAAANLLVPNGQMVIISPRSWTNGTYFRKFREFLASKLSLDAFHLFDSRGRVFRDTGVLQESIIWKVTNRPQRKEVSIRNALDHLSPVTEILLDSQIVTGQDFIFLPTEPQSAELYSFMSQLPETLESLGIAASTGKIVDFRNPDLLRYSNAKSSLAFIRQDHLSIDGLTHPRNDLKKTQWTCDANSVPSSLLCRPGNYVLVKRFSAKEEKRRVVASAFSSAFPVAIDNKVNFLHQFGEGIDLDLAHGLVHYLNSDLVDRYYRLFSGHTQVNAGDLMKLPFPDRTTLLKLGTMNQVEVETHLESLIFAMRDAA